MEKSPGSSQVVNVPNLLSAVRLLLALIVAAMIELGYYLPSAVIFLFAAATDFADGWWARKFNQVTKLGRILDPFVDKIIITAAMIALVGVPECPLRPWMATVIIGREFLVTSLRAMIEGAGGDFSARSLGKWKMVLQCAAVIACLLLLHSPNSGSWLYWTTVTLVWAAIALTLASGWDYVVQAIKA